MRRYQLGGQAETVSCGREITSTGRPK